MGERLAWRARANCAGKPPSLWFSGFQADVDYARSVCFRCPVRADCLNAQLTIEDELRQTFDGMFGGRTERERKVLLRLRGSEVFA